MTRRNPDEAAKDGPVVLPTYGRGGVKPGVDLDNAAAVLDLMEDPGHLDPAEGAE